MHLSHWLLFVANLPGHHQTLRMRVWRSLKSAGAGALRDGVYLLPATNEARRLFEQQSIEIQRGGGVAHILELTGEAGGAQEAVFRGLFDRSAGYRVLGDQLAALRGGLKKLAESEARRRLNGLRRDVEAHEAMDFFPGAARLQIRALLLDVQGALNAHFHPDEPRPTKRGIVHRNKDDYRGRTWATRKRPWIDRVCSAWLILRFIDPKAKFLWLNRPKDCPKRAVGFDFDGAEFTHVDAKVTFEVLLASFGLQEDPGLSRLATLVHFLDVGGLAIAEAPGLAAIIEGARTLEPDDDRLLTQVKPILDSLYRHYAGQESA